jgi:protoporphyrin/coproporphyrin ferrochelatase
LAAFTIAQTAALKTQMGDAADVRYAMRYGAPSIGDQLAAMKADGCERILIAPLYPQYSGATTGTVLDEAYRVLSKMRWHPALRTLPAYHDDPAYIAALKTSIEQGLAQLDFTPDAVLASFHGMPERTLQLGDPYHCHCRKTARLLSEAMGMPLEVSFQSRFGRAKWLDPATDVTLERLAKEGKRKLAIFAPGFSVDCLETLEELAIQGHEQFEAAGGTHYAYLPCLNADASGMTMLEHLVRHELSGWIEARIAMYRQY